MHSHYSNCLLPLFSSRVHTRRMWSSSSCLPTHPSLFSPGISLSLGDAILPWVTSFGLAPCHRLIDYIKCEFISGPQSSSINLCVDFCVSGLCFIFSIFHQCHIIFRVELFYLRMEGNTCKMLLARRVPKRALRNDHCLYLCFYGGIPVASCFSGRFSKISKWV